MFQFDSGNNNEDFVPLRKTSMGGEEAYAYNGKIIFYYLLCFFSIYL